MIISQTQTIIVPLQAAKQRLDLFLSSQLENQSRSALQRLIDDGHILVDGKTVRSSHKLTGNEAIIVTIPPPVAATPHAEEIPLAIIYEDSDLLVVNKPAGMTVHAGAGVNSGTLVNGLLAHCSDLSGIGGEIRPGIVHRLDKGTSGLLVVAKNDITHRALAVQFAEHKTKRIYQALVYGSPATETGKICNNIGRHPTDRLRYSSKAKQGKQATTAWKVLERFNIATLVQLRLETGRTHQIRVHLTEAGMPLLGDPLYPDGGRFNNLKDNLLKNMINRLHHQALHAKTIGFTHPSSNQFMEFSADQPEDFMEILNYLRNC